MKRDKLIIINVKNYVWVYLMSPVRHCGPSSKQRLTAYAAEKSRHHVHPQVITPSNPKQKVTFNNHSHHLF